jgi:hypothetical protein
MNIVTAKYVLKNINRPSPPGRRSLRAPVTCDDRSQPDGIMVIRVPAPALSHLRPALQLDGPA